MTNIKNAEAERMKDVKGYCPDCGHLLSSILKVAVDGIRCQGLIEAEGYYGKVACQCQRRRYPDASLVPWNHNIEPLAGAGSA